MSMISTSDTWYRSLIPGIQSPATQYPVETVKDELVKLKDDDMD